ncbi:MAG: sensor histidine kinase, partial [Armatimonadetes bacterium]|nr:sensor histidine kinase [Akkermansiaceae bacterium]
WPAGVDFQLLRIAQEALANALKHAQASYICISLESLPEGLRLRIRDDGQGFVSEVSSQVNGGHFGLLGMQERAIRIGALFTVTGKSGQGCTVTLFIPRQPPSKI